MTAAKLASKLDSISIEIDLILIALHCNYTARVTKDRRDMLVAMKATR